MRIRPILLAVLLIGTLAVPVAPASGSPEQSSANPTKDPTEAEHPRRAELAGKWVVDQSRSENMEEFLSVQGVPKFVRVIMVRAKVEQTNTVAGDQVSIKLRFPIGTSTETITADGQRRPARDRRGDCALTAAWTGDDALLITRVFEDFVVRERRSIEDGLLVLRFEVDEGGRTVRAKEVYQRS